MHSECRTGYNSAGGEHKRWFGHLITSIPLIWLTMQPTSSESSNNELKSRIVLHNLALTGSPSSPRDAYSTRILHAWRVM